MHITTNKMTLILMTTLAITACGQSSPMEKAGDQIADAQIKTRYASGNELTLLETRAKTEFNLSAKSLISHCAVAAMHYVKVPETAVGAVATQVINSASNGSEEVKQWAGGVTNHLERCISIPKAYDVGPK